MGTWIWIVIQKHRGRSPWRTPFYFGAMLRSLAAGVHVAFFFKCCLGRGEARGEQAEG
jgi:hypothetical protein